MIPADAANRLRLSLPELPQQPQPIQSTQQITDVLSDLLPGQRVMAEIQALLPNGAYRAVVGQRDITLALPFSAKAGDSLELEVVESDGKVSLAFVANRGNPSPPLPTEAGVGTRLSQAGRLIGDLLTGINEDGRKAQPAPLNSNQPLLASAPESGAEIVPLLKEALSKSGMFYEAQQARWVAGKIPSEELLAQPQGKLSPAIHAREQDPAPAADAKSGALLRPENPPPSATAPAADGSRPNTGVPQEIVPLVQQQLDALATQTYVWQGQAWPGQNMHLEIREEGEKKAAGSDEETARWQTRLQLHLPHLGGIDAIVRLRSASELEIRLTTESEATQTALNVSANRLRQQFEAAGLTLSILNIGNEQDA